MERCPACSQMGDWCNCAYTPPYAPGNGMSVIYWRAQDDSGVTYSRFREYHGPWPVTPERAPSRYDIEDATRGFAVARALGLLRECGFRIAWRYNYSEVAMVLYHNNELIADADVSEW